MAPLSQHYAPRAGFSFKLFTIFTVTTALMTIALTGWYSYVTAKEERIDITNGLRQKAQYLAESVRLPLYAETRATLQYLAEEAARDREIRSVRILTTDGRVLADIHGKHAGPSSAETISVTQEVRSSSLFSSQDPLLGHTTGAEGVLIGSVRIERDTDDLKQATRHNVATSFGLAALFWLAVSSLSYFVLKNVTRSFNSLMEGVNRMQAGDLSVRIKVHRQDEPGRAALAINALAETLQQRDEENRKLQEDLVQSLRVEVQNEKKLLVAKLIQTNRMTSIGLMASSMAHEINNPVGAIKMANQFISRAWEHALPLLDRVAAEEGNFTLGGLPFSHARTNVAECCGTIDRSAERITLVINDLLGYSLGERNEFHPGVDINRVVAESMSIVKAHGRYFDAPITSSPSSQLPTVTGSHHQLVQVVVNLLLNAIQALPDGKGNISISTFCAATTGDVRIAVHDDGTGISPEVREHLLEPFVSTRHEKGGSGLGLFVTNYIVTTHGGGIEFDSAPGAGTTVTVYIPLAQDHPQS